MTAPGAAAALGALCDWAAALCWADLPPDLPGRAGLILLDDFAALVAARTEPELVALRERLHRFSGPAEALVHDGAGRRMDRYSAALANGAGAGWCELDGGYRLAVCHAGIYCAPALLAEAEATGKTFRDALMALIAGYEGVARVARAFAFPRLAMHPHGGLATIGAAFAVAKLRGLDAGAMKRAVDSAAGLVAPGPFNHAVEGALTRNLWPGVCAQNGLRAVDWAGLGVSGGENALAEVMVDIFGAAADPAQLTEGLGESFAMRDGYHKMHACCQYAHSTVEAMQAALAAGPVDPGAVRAITVATHPKGLLLDNPAPATTLAAKFSIQHVAAATLAFGHAGAAAFHADTLADPALDALRRKVRLAPHGAERPWPEDRPAKVTLELADGRLASGECLSARGGSDRPFSQEEIMAKIAGDLGAAYPALAGRAAAVAGAEAAELARPVADLLSPG